MNEDRPAPQRPRVGVPRRVKIALLALLLVVSGTVIGSGATLLVVKHRVLAAMNDPQSALKPVLMRRLDRELNLTEEQYDQVDTLLDDHLRKLRAMTICASRSATCWTTNNAKPSSRDSTRSEPHLPRNSHPMFPPRQMQRTPHKSHVECRSSLRSRRIALPTAIIASAPPQSKQVTAGVARSSREAAWAWFSTSWEIGS